MKMSRGMAAGRHLGPLFEGQSVVGLGEFQLLQRFIDRRDEPAFAALVARHGPMVLGVCRRLLADPLDVEDAFQATFLILVRRAGSLRDRDRLASWLFGVARRVATRARVDLARRRARETSGVEEIVGEYDQDDPARELGLALVEEIDRLPGSLRDSVLLCCVEGLSYEEAAARLRSTAPAIRGRLARARLRLRDRLTRRGFAPTAGALGVLLSCEVASAAVSSRLLLTTIQVAKVGVVPAGVEILAEGVIRTMILTKSKFVATTLVALGLAGSSLGVLGQTPRPDPRPEPEVDRLDKVEKKLDRVLQALEAGSNRPAFSPTQAPIPPEPPGPPAVVDPATGRPFGLPSPPALKSGSDVKSRKTTGALTLHPAPPEVTSRLDALERKIQALEARLDKLERRADGEGRSEINLPPPSIGTTLRSRKPFDLDPEDVPRP